MSDLQCDWFGIDFLDNRKNTQQITDTGTLQV